VGVHQLSRRDARRIAIRAQWLHSERPTELVELVRHITLLQLDPTAAVAPSADLVACSRLGAAYDHADLDRALSQRELVELRTTIRPAEDIALYRAQMATWPGPGPLRPWQQQLRAWVEVNDSCRRHIFDRLSRSGPLPSRELPDTCTVPWRSTGWTNNRNVTQMLAFVVSRGEVAVAGRVGNERLWDLAERVYPDIPVVPWRKPHTSGTSAGWLPSALLALVRPKFRSSPSMSARPAKRRWSRAYEERGALIRAVGSAVRGTGRVAVAFRPAAS
jgi:uncharacterized protein